MSKPVKFIILCFVLVILIAFVFLFLYLIKPNIDINKNRETVDVADSSVLQSGGDRIHFLSTDSSDAILIESNGHFALVDCAEDSDNPRGFEELEYDGYEQRVLDYVKQVAGDENGEAHLDFVIGTHSHSDHIGGFDTLIDDSGITIDRAYLKEYDESKIRAHEVEKWDNKEVYTQMLDALNAKNVPVISDIFEPEFMLGNFEITLFNTGYDNSGEPIGENDNSIGVLIEKNGRKVFLSGDMDNNTGDEDKYGPLIGKVDVLKVGHHSYSGSTTTGWLKNLSPEVCVVTNVYEKTDKRTLRRITRVAKSPILITGSENGVVVDISDDGKITYYNNIH